MRLTSCLAFLPLLAGASPLPQATTSASAACPTPYYPVRLNDTSFVGSGLYLHVRANNPAYDGHNIQLRSTTAGTSFVAVDTESPVLAAELRNGTIHATGRDLSNNIYDLGPIGLLTNTTGVGNAQRFAFNFANASAARPADNEWYLQGLGNDGSYGLYHTSPLNIVNGFMICPSTASGTAGYEVFYYEYESTPGDLGSCESIGLQVSCIVCQGMGLILT